ncbi:MAG TPA: hypothetical protein VMF08_16345 [Candidatus Sulfotelmatobacter sp.]|nr:hypothetical protein [Candidatus Sulfotelmatobacter sp.]
MRTSAIIIFALLLVTGCKSSQSISSLSSDQATALALRLANDKADSLYHHRPFQDGQPAQFVAGKWVWMDGRGVALLDYQASVMLAADGSTNSVDVELLDDSLHPVPASHSVPVFPGMFHYLP